MSTQDNDSGRQGVSLFGMVLLLAGVGVLAQSQGWLEGVNVKLYQLWPVIPIVIGARASFNTAGVARLFAFLFLGAGLAILGFNLGWLSVESFGGVLNGGSLNVSTVIAVLLILAGLAWLAGGSRMFISKVDHGGRRLKVLALFGGQDITVSSPALAGGWVAAMFGGFELDLTKCQLETEEITIECLALFGGGEIHVPKGWRVELSGLALFGGFGNSTEFDAELPEPHRVLRINGVAMFGGFDVNNG